MAATIVAVTLVVAIILTGMWWVRRRMVVVTVDGVSMAPALRPGDRVLARRTRLADVRAGDIVVLTRPPIIDGQQWMFDEDADVPEFDRATTMVTATGDPDAADAGWLVKRVLAVPGDPVPRREVPRLRAEPADTVPPGRLVVIGDNVRHSYDSRTCGYFTQDQLLGVVLRRVARR